MDLGPFVDARVEQLLLKLHTGQLCRVLRVDADRRAADLQPLNLTKAEGAAARMQPILTGVPVLAHAMAWAEDAGDGIRLRRLAEGDVCLVLCCERDISHALRGLSTTPARRRHSLSDAVVIGAIV